MRPDVGSAGAGVARHAENRAYGVVLETCREYVGGAVAECVGNEDDRTMILLTDEVRVLLRFDRKSLREVSARLEGLLHGRQPVSQEVVAPSEAQRKRCIDEVQALGHDLL